MSLLGAILGLFGVLGAILLVVFSVFRGLIAKEVEATIPALSRSLMQRAAERLPEEQRERFQEEWPAELKEAIDKRPVWALMQAISLYQSAGRIAMEFEPATASIRGKGTSGSNASGRTTRLLGSAVERVRGARALLERIADRVASRPPFGSSSPRAAKFVRLYLTAVTLLAVASAVLFLIQQLFKLAGA